MAQNLQKRRTMTTDSMDGHEEQEDDMSASLPRSIRAPTTNAWDTTSVISSSTMGGTTAVGDEETLPTLASKGVESLLFSGLSNIDENRPLRGINNFARASVAAQADNNGSVGGIATRDDKSIGDGNSLRSNGTRSVRSVFTEKKQEDIDRLFEDLLGQSNDDNNSTASSVMSSVMPIMNLPNSRSAGTTFNRGRGRSNTSVVTGDRSVGGVSKASFGQPNQYIFDNTNGHNSGRRASDHELIYGNEDNDNKKLNMSVLDRFQRFYIARSNRMLHIRAGVILLFLCGIMFVFLQANMVNEYNRQQMKILEAEHAIDRAAYRPNVVIDPLDIDNMDRPVASDINVKNRFAHSVIVANDERRKVDPMRGTSPAKEKDSPGMEKLQRVVQEKENNVVNDENEVQDSGPVDALPKDPKLEMQKIMLANQKKMPDSFQQMMDVSEGTAPHREMPYFWQIPRAGGGTLRQILSECMGAVLAAEPGGQGPFAGDESLEVFRVGKDKFINVDTTFLGGIERAKELNLVGSKIVDVVVSPYVHELTTIFTPTNQGRMFAFFRHPIERCASMYAYKKIVDPEIASMSLLDYARSGRVENNWMTRFLSNQLTGEVTFDHVVIAKEVLRTKCLVGLKEFLWASIKRFEHYYGWQYTTDPAVQYECRQKKLLEDIDLNEFEQPEVLEGTQEWTMLLWQNKFDMKVYKYAQELFKEQLKLFPEGFS